ncbi:hypothetical protein MYAM1_003457 [Malassezia yamatoensis]|uniref:Uncharacterized protein n=1 Tax=Malassezia yamatoensis TaxID=253288 RepID=A0AAJ5Z1R1_9BASI|nr:hypothetical protein MYAM1_003457 [Malassezia yamatoensis]
MPDGASTPKAFAPLANSAQDNSSSRKSQADSLWHDGRTGRRAQTGSVSPMGSSRSGLSSASTHADETETPWQSFFSNYLPMGRGFFLDRQNSSRGDASAATSSLDQSTKLDQLAVDDTKADISCWSSITTPSHNMSWQPDPLPQPQADQTTPTPGLDPLQKEPQLLRIDTHVADSPCDDSAMTSATTYSSADLSSAASRYSAHARSSDTSQTSSPIFSQNRTEKTEKTSLPSTWAASYNAPSYTRPRAGNPVSVPSPPETSVRSKPTTRNTSPPVFDTSIGSGNGQFGVGVRSKLNTVLPILIGRIISQCSVQSPTVVIAEFGCLNSRSMQLLRPIIEEFAKRDLSPPSSVSHTDRSEAVNVKGIATLDLEPSSTNLSDFFVVHEDVPQADFRAFSHLLDTHPESYMNTAWQASYEPSLQNRIFCSYISRPFGSRIVPRDTLHFGFSLMDLHWTHTPNATDLSLATTAQAELTSFLMARATEFCKNGVLLMAFIARSEPEDLLDSQCEPDQSGLSSSCRSPPTTSSSNVPRDVWATMSDMLVPCLQRLVSCGMLKSNVARQLLTLPMHPRTPSQTMRVLKDLDHLWELDWSCGANQDTDLVSADGKQIIPSERQPLRLQQPAWVALQAGKITNAIYTEHVISMFKHLYESHFRMVLRERGKLGRGAVEFILDSLWDVLCSRIEDNQHNSLGECELEVQLIALRRK